MGLLLFQSGRVQRNKVVITAAHGNDFLQQRCSADERG